MTLELLRLEWRRNRLSAAAMAAAFLLTIPVAGLVSSTTGMEPGRAREALLVAWELLGLPLAACLIGAAAGAAASSRDAVEAEALLPVSARRRAWASLSVALALSLLLFALVLGVSGLLGLSPTRAYAPGEKAWGRSFWFDLDVWPLLPLAALDLLAGAWALSRLTGHGVAGGLLALVFGASNIVLAALGLVLGLAGRGWGSGHAAHFVLLLLAAAPAKALAAAWAAEWAERRGPRLDLARAALLFVLPTAALVGAVARELSHLGGRLKPLEAAPSFHYQHEHGEFPRSARALSAAGDGVLIHALGGGVHLAGPGGVAVVIKGSHDGSWRSIDDWWRAWAYGAWRDRDGRAWIDRYESPDQELWRIEDGRAERRRFRAGGGLVRPYAGLALRHSYPDGDLRLTEASELFERGDRARSHDGYAGLLRDRASELAAATPACGGRCLKAGGRTWALPGRALRGRLVLPDEAGGRRVYLVPVLTARGREVALCRDDGTVEIAWPLRLTAPGRWSPYAGLPDGTLFSFGPRRTLWAIGPDGRVAPPLSYDALAARLGGTPSGVPELVRRRGGEVWLVWGDRLAVLDSSGAPARIFPLAKGVREVRALKDGFLFETDRGLRWSDWEGRHRPLRAPL
jgi:hypothetical protein